MDNPIKELNNKVIELYGQLAKLEYELETLDVKKEDMRKDYANVSPAVGTEDKGQSTHKG